VAAGDRAVRRRFGAPLLLIAAFVLVAVLAANLAYLAEPLAGLPLAPDPSDIGLQVSGTTAAILLWGIGGAALAALIVILVRSFRRPLQGTIPFRLIAAQVLGIVAIVVVMSLFPRVRRGDGAAAGLNNTTTGAGAGVPFGSINSVVLDASGLPLILLVAALAVVVALLARRQRARTAEPVVEPEPPAPEARAEVARTIDQAIEGLELGLEPREAILRCYAALCHLLIRRGLAELEPLTPREVERLAIGQFGLAKEDIGALTSLFEEARYSEHALGPEARERALFALSRLRTALGA